MTLALFSQPVEKYLGFSTTFPQKLAIFYSTIDLLKAENLLPRLRFTRIYVRYLRK